jgi:hypothetical protein
MKTTFTKELPRRQRRSAIEERFAYLTILGILPRSWPQYALGTFTMAQAVAAADEPLPWEIDDRALKWSRYVGARQHDPNTKH